MTDINGLLIDKNGLHLSLLR